MCNRLHCNKSRCEEKLVLHLEKNNLCMIVKCRPTTGFTLLESTTCITYRGVKEQSKVRTGNALSFRECETHRSIYYRICITCIYYRGEMKEQSKIRADIALPFRECEARRSTTGHYLNLKLERTLHGLLENVKHVDLLQDIT
ncbi:hypothetical protein CDAR_244311 [Caerostris darwini]|uniref:Uncharacterized protein n=1 Tax=Caerostris darwini TaxID=1538125 RepID=A0AAV4RGZ0_9ARAC|nr:hypothetical protein CDAR_244311 [Caerostris darwini]